MGDHGGFSRPSCPLLNGLLPNKAAGVTRVLDADRWSMAEARTAELIQCIQPNQQSEECRNAVASYVQRLIMKCFSCQVFTFGSVPLKTYLPDGDIDMTAFSKIPNLKDTWADDVRNMLENEERSENAEFRVNEIQYIQAEVKIIKCLVENIVVDISFSQLGGLCTLCFLEEIDQFIDQDHLFKRSIILIKAWCYYESRILGAHHGLISTYALEILVLYIFHIFNNSFSGPLEVLYRFLEFFSNFDWENFCVSLWGPIPVNSLPNMTAEPPRKDNGEVLLSKFYLDAFGSKYSVSPGVQENQGQPFVSKYFNIIDPLRINNNLGRSVSKGNFYRIRSALAFGAKRLAGLLECPKDNLPSEVKKFFMNTWRQHRSSQRPDASRPYLSNMQPSSNVETPAEAVSARAISQPVSAVNRSSLNSYSPDKLSTICAQNQRNFDGSKSSRHTSQVEEGLNSSELVGDDRHLKSELSKGLGSFQFARTRSSPELSNTSADFSSRRQNRLSDTVKNQIPAARGDHASPRKNLGSAISINYASKTSPDDPSYPSRGAAHQNFDVPDDSAFTPTNQGNAEFLATGEGFVSWQRALEMYQKQQDLITMAAVSEAGKFDGQVPLPVDIPSPHLQLPSPSALQSMEYVQRKFSVLPENTPHWRSVVQFPHGLRSTQMFNYHPNAGLLPNPEVVTETSIKGLSLTEDGTENADRGSWTDQDNGSISPSGKINVNALMLHSDDKETSSTGSFSSSNIHKSSSYSTRNEHRFVREDQVWEDSNRVRPYQTLRDQDSNSADDITNLRACSTIRSSSSISKSSSESSWDVEPTVSSQLGRDNLGRKGTSTSVPSDGTTRRTWEYDNLSSDCVPIGADDNGEWAPHLMMGSDVMERTMDSASIAPMEVYAHPSFGYGSANSSSSDPMVHIGPVLVSSSSQPRTADNTGMLPFTFYSTGPPVPFFSMLPLSPYDSSGSIGSTSHFDNIGHGNVHRNSSDSNFDLTEDEERPVAHIGVGSMRDKAFEQSEVHKPDILNSDFANHWQNLQFGRFCQDTRYHGPLMYPSPAVIPPMYFQGHFPLNSPGKPLVTNMELFDRVMNHGPATPVASVQPGQIRPTNVYRCYLDDVPRHHGGTGTYLPSPNLSFRDQQSPHALSHRGHYGNDHNDRNNSEGSWLKSKSRASGRSRDRSQMAKVSPRSKRLTETDNMSEKPWDSYRDEPPASYPSPSNPFSSMGAHGSANMPHGTYPLPTGNSNRADQAGSAAPSAMMLYSYDDGAGQDDLSSEQPEFGLRGSVLVSGVDEAAHAVDGDLVGFTHRQEAYGRGSGHSSPVHPSSPQAHQG